MAIDKNISENTQESDLNDAVNANFAVIEFDKHGIIQYANSIFLKTMGYKIGEIQGHHHKMFCDVDYRKTLEYKNFWKDLGNGVSFTSEFQRIKSNGEIIWLKGTYYPVLSKTGLVIKIIKIAQDITAEQIKSANYEAQLDAISLSQGVIEFSLDGKILFANKNFLDLLGYHLEDIRGKHHSMFCTKEYKASVEYKEFWEKLNRGSFDTGEYKRIGNNGKEVWIQASYNPILDFYGNPYKVVKYATDITKTKTLMFGVEDSAKNLKVSSYNLQKVGVNMNRMLESLQSISDATSEGDRISNQAQRKSDTTTKLMLELTQQSKSIGKVLKTIRSISKKTNLLSLNAAIEAAKAGKAGAGFAVVALEIKGLSLQTSDATEEVYDSISAIQESTNVSMEAITDISKIITDIANISEGIVLAVEEQKNISNEVSDLMKNVKQEVDHITEVIHKISLV